MKRIVCKRILYGTVAGILISMLPGCGRGGDESPGKSQRSAGTGEAVIMFGSKTVLTSDEFRKKLKMLQEAQPGLENIISSMPEGEQLKVYERFAEGCVAEQLISEYVKNKGLDATQEYRDMAQQAHETLDTNLRIQAFQNDLTKQIDGVVDRLSDEEVRAYYMEHRDKDPIFKREPFIKRRPGGKPEAVEKPEFAPFEEVRDMVRQVIKQERLNALYNETMEILKKQYGVKVENVCLQQFVVKKEVPATAPEAHAVSNSGGEAAAHVA